MPLDALGKLAVEGFVDHEFAQKAGPVLAGMNKQFSTGALSPSSGDYTVTAVILAAAGIKEVQQVNAVRIVSGLEANAAFISAVVLNADGTITISGLKSDAATDASSNVTFLVTADVILL